MPDTPLLNIRNLTVAFGKTEAVRGISLQIVRGEMLALVGESGSGKSVSALSLLRLLPEYARIGGKAWLEESVAKTTDHRPQTTDLLHLPESGLQAIRGKRIGIIFQEPMTSLNPLHTIEKQLAEIITLHQPLLPPAKVRERICELLEMVELGMLTARLSAYPHELSGGQRQRVMIAMALANTPDLLIADEPTTALDVTVQATILNLIRELQKKLGMAVLLITHDLTIVQRLADSIAVMQHGEIVEYGSVKQVIAAPQHPYTRELLASVPSGDPAPLPGGAEEVLRAEKLKVYFPIRRGMLGRVKDYVKAVDGVDVRLRTGETLGVVGESGSGKTTLGLALLRLTASEGGIFLDGEPVHTLSTGQLRPKRRAMQFVFQDPFSSLNPRMSVGQIIGEGLRAHGLGADKAERQLMIGQAPADVGLAPEMMDRYPHEFSGGQRQRIGIARALVLSPRLIVLDEPTSALDVSTQSAILKMLKNLQQERGLGFVFISHDLRVIKAISHSVLVMQNGKVVESGTRAEVFGAPKEEYTRRLITAAFEVR